MYFCRILQCALTLSTDGLTAPKKGYVYGRKKLSKATYQSYIKVRIQDVAIKMLVTSDFWIL